MNRFNKPAGLTRQTGSVLIIVLWTAVLLTVLVTALAGKVRLSARTAAHNQDAGIQWAELMAAVNQAEMELLLEQMPPPIDEEQETSEQGEIRRPAYRFNGQPLTLHYSTADDIVVRIYNHAGKINLNRIPRRNMQMLIEKRLGGLNADPEEVQDLLAAWTDWTDLNDLEGLNGAEKEYYQSLELAYSPRNNPELETVEEILHIRGFAELFEGVNLDAAFTIYGNVRRVNLNLATREAMQLLPGLNDELIENILAFREYEDFSGNYEIREIVPFENMQELNTWIDGGSNGSNFYSVFAYPALNIEETILAESEEEFINPDPVSRAYMEIIEVSNYNSLPRVHKIDPYGHLPDTAPPRVHEEDLLFDRL